MNRRDFLRSTLATTAAYSAGGLPGISRIAMASSFAPVTSRTLVNVMLDGGPDFRHLFAPAYNADTLSFGYRYWQANSAAHSIEGNPNAWEQRWNQNYQPVGSNGFEFGILNNCGWLQSMWDSGKVAIISNVYGSSSRDHAHSALVLDQGNRNSGPANSLRPGWGGRLAAASGGNVVALTRSPRPFCFGPHPTDAENRSDEWTVAAQDVRSMKLYTPEAGTVPTRPNAVIERALRGYYSAKRNEFPLNSPRSRFANLEQQLREFGEPLDARLQDLPVPENIASLYNGTQTGLASAYFGEQIRNLHDSLAVNDILNMRIASLEYRGFD
ncbi:MAG: hypothetical protein OEQ74_10770, partial [Gammaproteobacteria bacterium]|nr:hypothetical protein [Gammaproteobacteria bacterium]